MKKNGLLCAALAAVLILLLVGIWQPKKDESPKASALTQQRVKEGDQERIFYVDDNGQILQPSDQDYAIQVRTRNDAGKMIRDEYLDVNGDPAVRKAGYCTIAYEQEENALYLHYLDAQGQPVTIKSGYASIYRTKTPEGKALRDTYFDTQGNPVDCADGYHGFQRTYDDQGQVTQVQYLDKNGSPTRCRSGYSRELRVLDDNGKTIQVSYLDENGQPMAAKTGQYGERYQRDKNGALIQTTYLDAAGEPMALSKGQYGVRIVNGKEMYLDRSGHVMLSVDNLLNRFSHMSVLICAVLCILLVLLPAGPRWLLLAAYVLFIFYKTLMFREAGDSRTSLMPFTYLKQFLTVYSVRAEVINNVCLFIPLGAGLRCFRSDKRLLWIPLALSLVIEAAQFVFGLGLAETNDVLGNTLGGVLGYLIAGQLLAVRASFHRKKR